MSKYAGTSGGSGVRYALVFPNAPGVAMANLGFQTVYGILSSLPEAHCELFSAGGAVNPGSGSTLNGFDVVAFSLSFEGDYPNIPALLSRAGIEPLAAGRRGDRPLILAGGMAPSLNPEPLAAVADVLCLGEAEANLAKLHLFFSLNRGVPKDTLLRELAAAKIPGVYVPSAYRVGQTPGSPARLALFGAPETICLPKAPKGWEPAHSHIIEPTDAFGGAYLLEVSRGCPHGCRFCAAGHISRPARFVDLEILNSFIAEGLKHSEKIGFVGAAVSDHPKFKSFAEHTLSLGGSFTVSSFRAENLDAENLELLKRGGLRTLTVAIEAGGERLRAMIGKRISGEDLFRAAELAVSAGIRNMRVYGMIGLPGETDADIILLSELVGKAKRILGGGELTLSVAPFVPKPHTPFQWEAMAPEKVLTKRMRLITAKASVAGVRVAGESPKWARLQGLFSRGPRWVGEFLATNPGKSQWGAMLKGERAKEILDTRLTPGDPLPWDFITGGPSPEHLLREHKAATALSPPTLCPSEGCDSCGICL